MTQLLAGTLCSGFGLAWALPWLAISYELAPAEAMATLTCGGGALLQPAPPSQPGLFFILFSLFT
jgi:hypothetical protein